MFLTARFAAFAVFFACLPLTAGAESTPKLLHGASAAETALARAANQKFLEKPRAKRDAILRPVEDFADFKYVLVSAELQGLSEARELRRLIAQNLPAGVTLVVLAAPRDAEAVRRMYSQWMGGTDRLVLATDATAGVGFWARDSFPVPVYTDEKKNVGLMSIRYYRDFRGQAAVASSVSAEKVFRHEFVFVGGNLIADEDGNCFAVNSYRLFDMTGESLRDAYGCRTMQVLPHVAGIGDVDEVIKPLGGKRMLTNAREYVPLLEGLGYQVTEIADIGGYRTYVNALVVGGTVFMPAYGVAADAEARATYERLGFRVVPIRSNVLSDEFNGSVHCQTMAYPDMDLRKLLGGLNLREL